MFLALGIMGESLSIVAQRRIINIIKKEWEITFKDVNSALLVTLLPLIIIAQVLLLIYFISKFINQDALMNPILQRAIQRYESYLFLDKSLSLTERFQLILVSQFPFYLLLIPVMIAINIATFSIVEEKQTKTLEPLLATPVKTWELLMGKALSGAIPAIISSWLSSLIFIVGATFIIPLEIIRMSINASWLISLFVLVPGVSLMSFLLGVISSSRASDPKNAQNISIVVIIPVLAIMAIQMTGILVFTSLMLLFLSAIVCVLDLLVLRVAVKLFDRESILIKWK
ncbi:MAG: ABC transporter permease subunit [bacterium]